MNAHQTALVRSPFDCLRVDDVSTPEDFDDSLMSPVDDEDRDGDESDGSEDRGAPLTAGSSGGELSRVGSPVVVTSAANTCVVVVSNQTHSPPSSPSTLSALDTSLDNHSHQPSVSRTPGQQPAAWRPLAILRHPQEHKSPRTDECYTPARACNTIPDVPYHLNCSLFIDCLPGNVTFKQLLGGIRYSGRI